jgi:glyoxylase-like metal-dependent hydrolase (beta-lactamase superfamily II)
MGALTDWNYTKGLHRVSEGVYAYCQPDGSWGLNNTALLVSKGESMMMDTTSDVPCTQAMLRAMAEAEPAAARTINTVILTHWHVDHVHGINAPELKASRIYASRICADWMKNLPPKKWLEAIASLEGTAKQMMEHNIGKKFDFTGLDYVPPTDIFEGDIEIKVGDRKVIIAEQKPAHTRSDSIVWIPEEGVAHTGDLIGKARHQGTQFPFMSNLIASVKKLISWGPDVVVPGHGPLMNLQDVKDVLEYCQFITDEARKRYDKGMKLQEATDDILANMSSTKYKSYRGAFNLFFTVKMLYCEFSGDTQDHVRRNYPEYLATAWRNRKEVPEKYPELFARI